MCLHCNKITSVLRGFHLIKKEEAQIKAAKTVGSREGETKTTSLKQDMQDKGLKT